MTQREEREERQAIFNTLKEYRKKHNADYYCIILTPPEGQKVTFPGKQKGSYRDSSDAKGEVGVWIEEMVLRGMHKAMRGRKCDIQRCTTKATKVGWEFIIGSSDVCLMPHYFCEKHFKRYGEHLRDEDEIKDFPGGIMSWEQYEEAIRKTFERKPELKKKFRILKREHFFKPPKD